MERNIIKKFLEQTFGANDPSFLVLENLDLSCFVVELETQKIIYANPYFYKRVEKIPEKVLGKEYFYSLSEEASMILDSVIGNVLHRGITSSAQYVNFKDEWIQLNGKRIYNENNVPFGIFTISHVQGNGPFQENIERIANYHQMLNIPNEHMLEKNLTELDHFDEVALIHFSIDNFNTINLIYNWKVGDYLLAQIRDWIHENLISGAKLYRAGDEFAILINPISLANAKKCARFIMKRFSSPWHVANNSDIPIYCTVTVGIIYGEYLRTDIRKRLLRTLTTSGNGSIKVYDEDMDKRYNQKFHLRQALVDCIKQNMEGFFVRYQPVVDAKTGKYVGVESLCRWYHKDFGVVSPALFIPELEQMGFITLIDDWVFRTSLKAFHTNKILKDTGIHLNINLSPFHLINKASTARNMALLHLFDFEPERLTLEITETSQFDFSVDNLSHLQHLRDQGLEIALDDFGTGYNTFENLVKIPVSVLKTDRNFIIDLETNSYLQYVLKSMIEIAHVANLKVVCEGVETQGQKDILTNLGADYIQGFFFDKPLLLDELIEKIQKQYET